jgi:hypothetical protein
MTDQQLSVEQVNPSTLLVDVNIRSDAALDKDFLASIRDLGVLVQIVAVRTEDGALRVRYGHRRTLAAVEVGRTSVRSSSPATTAPTRRPASSASGTRTNTGPGCPPPTRSPRSSN